jgi:hypothetical protein
MMACLAPIDWNGNHFLGTVLVHVSVQERRNHPSQQDREKNFLLKYNFMAMKRL